MSFSQVRSEGGSFNSDLSDEDLRGMEQVLRKNSEITRRSQKDQLTKKLNFYRPLKERTQNIDIVPTSPSLDIHKRQEGKASLRYNLAEKSLNMPLNSSIEERIKSSKDELASSKEARDKAAVLNRYFSQKSPDFLDKENLSTQKAEKTGTESGEAQQELTSYMQRLADANFQIEILTKENDKLKADFSKLKRERSEEYVKLKEKYSNLLKKGESHSLVQKYENNLQKLKGKCESQRIQIRQLNALLEKQQDRESVEKSLVLRLEELEAKLAPPRKDSPQKISTPLDFETEIRRNAKKIEEVEGELFKAKPSRRPPSNLLNRTSKSRNLTDSNDISSRPLQVKQPEVKISKASQLKPRKCKKKQTVSAKPRQRKDK